MSLSSLISQWTLTQPAWLALLLLCVPVAWLGQRNMKSLGPVRQWIAITLRCLVLLVLILLLAGLSRVDRNENLAVIAVMDRSQSIPTNLQEQALDGLTRALERKPAEALFALVDVAEAASISRLPSTTSDLVRRNASLQGHQTRLDVGIEMAMAIAPPDTPVRLVLASEGNQTTGDLRRAAQVAATNGIPIDVMPLTYRHDREVIFKRLVAPARARPQETVSLRFVLESTQPVTGKLNLFVNGHAIDLSPGQAELGQSVTLDAGINAVQVSHQVAGSGAYAYEAVFVPDVPESDRIAANNKATAMVLVTGPGRIVLADNDGQAASHLASSLSDSDMEIQVQSAADLPQDLAPLLGVDALILVNVDNSTLTYAQQEMLQRYVTDLGGGLVMVGGPESFGAGGWIGSPVAEILPVELDPPDKKQMPKGALVQVLDRSGSMNGQKVMMAKAAAKGAVRLLSHKDLTGTILFDSHSQWLVPITEVGDKQEILKALGTIGSGGGTAMAPALQMALDELRDLELGVRHVIVLSDGQTANPERCAELAEQMAAERISVSTVGIGSDINQDLMQYMAQVTHGRFYQVNDPARIPQIFVKEAQVVRRAMIVERHFVPRIEYGLSEILKGVEGLPPLDGYVLTAPKGGLNQVLLQSDESDPILAAGQAGLGRCVAFTSSVDGRWAPAWLQWSGFAGFWQQGVRWAAKPQQPTDIEVVAERLGTEVTVEAEVHEAGGVTRMTGQVLTPDMQVEPLSLNPIGPGRYRARFQASAPGSYVVNVSNPSGEVQSRPVSAVVTVPFAPEFQDLQDNLPLMTEVAALTGGRVLSDLSVPLFDLTGVKVPETHMPLTRPLLILWLILFLLDVAVRRVALDLVTVWQDVRQWARRRNDVQEDPTLSRLRQRRERLQQQLHTQPNKKVASTRFAAAPERKESMTPPAAKPVTSEPTPPTSSEPVASDTRETETAAHIQQLLRAKRRGRTGPDDPSQGRPNP